ncbi:MAG: hypothetical protein R3D89_01355 [Sphingomonadaceae bacterium]
MPSERCAGGIWPGLPACASQAIARKGELTAPIALKAVDDKWPIYGKLLLADGRETGPPPAGQVYLPKAPPSGSKLPRATRSKSARKPSQSAGSSKPSQNSSAKVSRSAMLYLAARLPAEAGLTTPGAMYRSKTRLALPLSADPEAVRDAMEARFPTAGFEFRTRDRASPGAERFVRQMGEFSCSSASLRW